jgi:hypothetical protein
MLKLSPTTLKIIPALALAQAELKTASKDTANLFFKSQYADLASVWDAFKEPFIKHGLMVLQSTAVTHATDTESTKAKEGEAITTKVAHSAFVVLTTRIIHSASGEWIESDIGALAKDAMPQSVGAAVTYLRRYGAQALIGIISDDDDDGETAHGRGAKVSSKGVVEKKMPKWTTEQSTEGGAIRREMMEIGKDAEKALNDLWHKMKYDEPSDTLDAMRNLAKQMADVADQAAGSAQ